MTDAELLTLESLAAKATPGPWVFNNGEVWSYHEIPGTKIAATDEWREENKDSEFIAASRTAIPSLIAALRREREANAIAVKTFKQIENYCKRVMPNRGYGTYDLINECCLISRDTLSAIDRLATKGDG